MLRFLAPVLCLLLATPALAEPTTVTVVNRSVEAVTRIAVFPLRADGTVIDDNIGGFYDEVRSGESVRFALPLAECAPVRFYVQLASMAGTGKADLELDVDTCTVRAVAVSD